MNNPNITINLNGLNNLKTLNYGGPQLNSATFLNQIKNIGEFNCKNGNLTILNLTGFTNLKRLNCSKVIFLLWVFLMVIIHLKN